MGEKRRQQPDDNYMALADAIRYLGDQLREGLADVADGLRSDGRRLPSAHEADHVSNSPLKRQEEKAPLDEWTVGQDEIPEMRNDAPLPNFGRPVK